MACVSVFSVLLGVGAIWAIASPDVIGRLPTSALLGIVGLMVLPLMAIGALALDRRVVVMARAAARREASAVVFLDGSTRSAAVEGVGGVLSGAGVSEGAEVPVAFASTEGAAIDQVSPRPAPARLVAAHRAEATRQQASRHRHLRTTTPAQE